jgi:uncharacterized protein (DUF433 family)
MKDHPDIRIDKQICGGQAVIKGHRIMVWILVEMRNEGFNNDQILEQYPSITESDVQNAFKYYETHKQEIDDQISDVES